MRLKTEIASSLPKPHFHCTNFSRDLEPFVEVPAPPPPKKKIKLVVQALYYSPNIQELWTSGFVVPNTKSRSQCCIVARKNMTWDTFTYISRLISLIFMGRGALSSLKSSSWDCKFWVLQVETQLYFAGWREIRATKEELITEFIGYYVCNLQKIGFVVIASSQK